MTATSSASESTVLIFISCKRERTQPLQETLDTFAKLRAAQSDDAMIGQIALA